MKKINAALEYRNTDQIRIIKPDDANSVLLKCFDELINSVKSFHDNIVPSTSNYRKKSFSFSKALTIIYSLQSSIDFEKDQVTQTFDSENLGNQDSHAVWF